MFVQVIEGSTKSPEELHRRLEIWERDLMPGAVGYLGSTGGCTSSGDCIMIARFESRDAVMRNSARPEQSEWWAQTEKCFDGPVRFHDTEDVQLMSHGELDSATFVQVMEGHFSDRDRLVELEARGGSTAREGAAGPHRLRDGVLQGQRVHRDRGTSAPKPPPVRPRPARCPTRWH